MVQPALHWSTVSLPLFLPDLRSSDHLLSFGQYCSALFQNPPDTSVCKKKPKENLFGTANVDLSQQVYEKAGKEGNTIVFEHSGF